MRQTLPKDSEVVIEINGKRIVGTVLTAEHWDEKSGWYMELLDENGQYRYWKQGTDGGKLISVKEPL